MRVTSMLRLAAAAAAAALAVSGCGGGDEPAEASDTSDATRTVVDATGTEVTVPQQPQRIVALSEQDLDSLLALDITPVGTVNGRGQTTPPAYLGDRTDGIEVVGDIGKPATDRILELEPDLVLFGAVIDEQQLEQMRELIPATVVTYKVEDDWKTAFRNIADAVNAGDAAEQWLTDYETSVGDAAEALGDNAGATANIVRWNPDGPGVMLKDSFASLVIQDVGLVRPEGTEPGFAHTDPLSLENLPELDADWLFVGTLVPGSEEALSEAKGTPAFAALEAVKSDHFVEVDGTLWTSRGGPLAALIVVEDVVTHLGA
ncbi:iron complex transport system substrate-binding protein [Stackebrandtia albiflava]|uniref:Iron complex transport system substrate-binding protein n=1 Tax=Stackebrandtia albiflava TaxID=406432 RepID=A0A562VBH0_9ACTN|nr:ABC transporter substrate-binding protein [Stackebrandtia albiflava]TWJ15219.1 iron complex transport system substrate-binding protein [Stackebrandtia albiflava]